MYIYDFDAHFVCGLPATNQITRAIQAVELRFNSLVRPVNKVLAVGINPNGGLSYHLVSDIPIESHNLLRSTQYFSKELSKEPVMKNYVRPRRLMKK